MKAEMKYAPYIFLLNMGVGGFIMRLLLPSVIQNKMNVSDDS